ncbi:uncharacterized protein H6S33_011619 [Morchella sextelata]|uniref:uncharacterized protein n=1 Tax=Morchella sextelata TaxID=1174677 RepID=UPI001D03FCF3|nr:uncharacterized protein H6S33_011619 [Morchella sextelata]KAH0611192.1 hypothetical protein H6S33_011619 [Morchella sextelata]
MMDIKAIEVLYRHWTLILVYQVLCHARFVFSDSTPYIQYRSGKGFSPTHTPTIEWPKPAQIFTVLKKPYFTPGPLTNSSVAQGLVSSFCSREEPNNIESSKETLIRDEISCESPYETLRRESKNISREQYHSIPTPISPLGKPPYLVPPCRRLFPALAVNSKKKKIIIEFPSSSFRHIVVKSLIPSAPVTRFQLSASNLPLILRNNCSSTKFENSTPHSLYR